MSSLMNRLTRPQGDDNPLWLIVLCDLMTNLMLFFLVMYAFTLQNPKTKAQWLKAFDAAQLIDTQQAKADGVVGEFKERQAADALVGLIKSGGLANSTDINVTERAIRVRLRDQILFDTARAGLSPDAAKTLALLARVLREIPNDILVEGHTDDIPIVGGPYKTNWELSVARSATVIGLLTREGVAPGRLIAAGYGPYHPLAVDGVHSRARDRRVEIIIMRGGASTNETD